MRLLALVLAALASAAANASISGSPTPNSNGNYTVQWTPVSGALSNQLRESTNGGATWSATYNVPPPASSKSFTGKAPGTYTYALTSCHTGSASAQMTTMLVECDEFYGTTNVVVTPPAPSAPTVSPQPATDNNGSYSVNWSAPPGAANYRWQERVNGGSWGAENSTSTTSLSRTGKSSATYGYRVKACNPTGCSGYSAEKSVIVAVTPGVPSSIAITPDPSTGAVNVNWGIASGSVTKYDFDYKKSTASSWAIGYDGTNLSAPLSGLTPGTWNYRVRACKTQSTYTSCSGWRTGNSTILLPPAVPGGLTAPTSDADGTYPVSWDLVSTASSYTLERKINGGTPTTQNTSSTSVNEAGLASATYSYRVRACNAVGCSSYSSSVTVTVHYSASYQYDELGRLTEASAPGTTMNYDYDDAGNRHSIETVQEN